MKKFIVLQILFVFTLTSQAQDTRCTNVVYASLYRWSEAESDFLHESTYASTLKFCMSENHIQINNQVNTFIVITKSVGKYEVTGKTEMSFKGTDAAGKDYTITYIFRDSGPYYMRMQVNIWDWALRVRAEYYLNPI